MGRSAQRRARLIAQRIFLEKPALVVHTGDLVYPSGSYDFYQRKYFNYYARNNELRALLSVSGQS